MATARAPCLSDALIEALDELDDYCFQRFKLFLMDRTLLGKFEAIKKRKVETEDPTKILKAMMDSYGIFTISVMKTVLKELHQLLILQKLCKYPYDPEAIIAACQEVLQSKLMTKFQFLVESLFKKGQNMLFNEGYTELYFLEADTGQVNEGHEVRQMEKFSKTLNQERTIHCQDIFKGSTETGDPIRAVLTKGVAGVGKTVLTQKFSLDWAEGRANQDIQLLFHFTFRYLNKFRDTKYSLVGLLHHCFSETKKLFSFQCIRLLFIFDSLDECRLPLDFSRTRVLTDPTESASVEELLVNLIRGDLFPSARLWITTRPAAANQIPAECVSMVTEVRGFTDPQKEQYFMKRFRDEQQATAVISHIKSIRSLYIMSSIPIFCWILSTVLLKILEQTEKPELPKTLTEMYVHFLVVQAKVKNIKFHGKSGADLHWTPETKEMVRSLVKLAFEQLQKGKLIFYESDLRECGLNAAEIARYSGVFTEVFREESGLYEDKVYCFIHLSVQEFLAALHVHQTFFSSGENLLSPQPCSESPESESAKATKQLSLLSMLQSYFLEPSPQEAFYRSAVDQALQSPNGHLDLFLRFLLGLSLPTNQRLLSGLLTETGNGRPTQETVKYIKEKLNEKGVTAEKSLNLLHCLNELNDHSLLEQIQHAIRAGRLSDKCTSPAQWSALSFLLLSSDSELEEFDLRKFCRREEAFLGLLPVIKASTKAILSSCGLSSLSCGPLASVLSSSSLTHLDLSNNDLQDSGVELLCEGLKRAPCRLETLRLRTCNLSNLSCGLLASVLSSSSLTHLDLSNNDLQDSGVELLCEGLKSAPCRLETLSLSGCLVSERGGVSLVSTLSSASSHLRELDLSYNHPGTSADLLTALRAPHGPLLSLRLDPAGERWMVPGPRKYYCELTLQPNTAQIELRVSEDKRTVDKRTLVKRTLVRGIGSRLRLFPPPAHQDTFSDCCQVLCSSGLRGRCYWEVQWRGWFIDIAVSYREIKRRGADSRFGENDQSWSLRIENGQYYFLHKEIEADVSSVFLKTLMSVSPVAPSGRVGVFLDSEAGVLSFYAISSGGELSHLHTFSCSFTGPLFPGFGLGWRDKLLTRPSVSLVNVKTEGT